MTKPQFKPARERYPAVLVGVLIWVLATGTLLWVIGHGQAVGIALVVTLSSTLIWAMLLGAGRFRRERRERGR